MPVSRGPPGARGDLHVRFDIAFPRSLSEEQKEALRLALPPLPRLAELEAVAFHDLDVIVDRAACAVLCKSLRSVYLAALDFGVGVTVFVHEAGRVGLDLRFATRPLRAVFTPNQMAAMDDGSAPVEVVG